MGRIKILLIINLIITLGAINGLTKILETPQVTQEKTEWCWAGVSQSVLDYYGESFTQTQIAQYGTGGANIWNWLWGRTLYPTRNGIDIILNHFAGVSTTPYPQYLSLIDLEENISDDKPVVIRWGWSNGGGHFVIARGIESDKVHIMDPFYGASINTYNWVRNGSNHTWTHTLEMVTRPPILSITPSSLVFSIEDTPPSQLPQTLQITNSGDRDFDWFAASDAEWLVVDPESGNAPCEIDINIDTSNLIVGTYGASITIIASGAQNSPQTIPISLEIKEDTPGLDDDQDVDGIDIAIIANSFNDHQNKLDLIASQFGSTNCNSLYL
ncbi:MAG: C39 family peptidase [Desulfobacterium sp.]|nr:C39 family peptidase [Desulfobacterium sp.]